MKTINTVTAFAFLALLSCTLGCRKDEKDFLRNKVPVADAGLSMTLTLPIKDFQLQGSGHDSDGQVVSYLWSQVSGPNKIEIINPGSPSTSANGFVEGAYIFQLQVTDNDGATGVDTITVTAKPAPIKTVTFQPSNNPAERMLILIGNDDQSAVGSKEWVLDAWTIGGKPYTGRILFKFDLSSIPASANVVSANLYVYSNNPPINGNLVDPNFGTSNGLLLQRVVSDWSPSSANWFNQPATTTSDEVLVPHTDQSVLDLNLNVTELIKPMISGANYGFLMRLQNEEQYNSRMFVSSYHPSKTDQHPKLVVVYE